MAGRTREFDHGDHESQRGHRGTGLDNLATIADPNRLPDWNMTCVVVTPLRGDPLGFEAQRTLADWTMRPSCRVVRAESPTTLAFVCHGDVGESVHGTFTLAAGPGDAVSSERPTATGRPQAG